MVGFGQLAVTRGRLGEPARGVDSLRLSDLRLRTPAEDLNRPHRADCHLLSLVSAGHGSHSIDFVRYPCRPGTVLWVRPGQVHQFGRENSLDATTHDLVAVELLRHQLAVLLMRVVALQQQAAKPPAAGGEVMTAFRKEIEGSFATTRRVEDYAERLGCSVRTLTRACLAATGRSAKQVIDDRVTLEAKRLLAHTDLPVASIGSKLGFTEATNFGRFFMRETGQTPGEFRVSTSTGDRDHATS